MILKPSFVCFQVEQRDVPGIDCAHLAMDTEEGVEVVWNEVQFSERKNFKAQEDKIQMVFDNLTRLEHPNIVKFHRYWTDTHNDKPRVSIVHSNFLAFTSEASRSQEESSQCEDWLRLEIFLSEVPSKYHVMIFLFGRLGKRRIIDPMEGLSRCGLR